MTRARGCRARRRDLRQRRRAPSGRRPGAQVARASLQRQLPAVAGVSHAARSATRWRSRRPGRGSKPLYDSVRRALGRHVLVMAHLSHAYPDGCSIYFTFSGAAEDDDARARASTTRAWRDALDAAIEAGGTLSHHHGVGRSKAPRLGEELGSASRSCDASCAPGIRRHHEPGQPGVHVVRMIRATTPASPSFPGHDR